MTKSVHSVLPLLVVLSPWIALVGAGIWGEKRPDVAKWFYVGAIAVALGLILSMYGWALDSTVIKQHIAGSVTGLSLGFRVDTMGFYFALILAVIWLLAGVYSLGYIDKHETRYYSFFAINLSFCLGVAFSANMFTLFVFYELMSLCTYPLIIHDGTEVARKAGLKYLVYSISAGAVLLAAMVLQYAYGHTLAFTGRGTLPLAGASTQAMLLVFALYMLGFGVKACIMPLHGWVPDAHPAAPSPASAILSGVILKVGIFGIIRVAFEVFGKNALNRLGVGLPMLWVASFTIVVASIFAITQDDLKRRLAYSSISQVSYIILGIFLLTPAGETGGLLQIAHHAFMKGALFLCAGIIIHETGKRRVCEMDGIARRLPITMAAFTVAALGMIGVPATCGFITKWELALGADQAARPYFIAVILVSSLLNAIYFLPIIYAAYFKQAPDDSTEAQGACRDEAEERRDAPEEDPRADGSARGRVKRGRETRGTMLVPVMIASAMVVVMGIFVTAPGLPYQLVKVIVHSFGF